MKNKYKIIPYVFLALTIGATSCSPPTQEQLDREKLINDVKNTSLSLPATTTGGVSGSISFLNAGTVTPSSEVKLKIIRQNDIPKLNTSGKPVDTTGKEFTNAKTQTQAFIEKKGDTIKNEVLKINNRFFVSDLRPGDISITVSSGSDSYDTTAKIIAGRVTQVSNIVLGSLNKPATRVGVNIKGRVLRPDGTPVANAKVADVSQGAATSSTTTNSEGEFTLQVNSFTKAKNLEATLDSLTASITVPPDQTEDVIFSLITNARTVKGRLIDSVNKKPIANMAVRSVETNNSTSTDSNGQFTLRGISTGAGNLEFGPQNGYILKQESIAQSETNETTLNDIEVQPIGNVLINVVADSFPDPLDFSVPVPGLGTALTAPFTDAVDGIQAVNLSCSQGINPAIYYVSNPFYYTEPIRGTIQIEGTDINQSFTYPVTPTLNPPPKCKATTSTGEADAYSVTVYGYNKILSIPINNLPGGEYTISVTLDFHETQKGIKVVIPSKDTISTELIQMRRVKRVLAVGDVVGRIFIKDVNNNDVNSSVKVRVLALKGEVDLRNQTVLKRIFSAPDKEILNEDGTVNRLGSVSSYSDFNISGSSSGQYSLTNVPTGTRVIIAGVIDGDVLSPNYLISSYTSLNVVGNTVNRAPDTVITRR